MASLGGSGLMEGSRRDLVIDIVIYFISRLFLKFALSITISMESSRRDLFIDIVIYKFIFKNNHTTFSPGFTFISETGLHQTGVSIFFLGEERLSQVR